VDSGAGVGGGKTVMTFQEIIESIEGLPAEDQELLFELILDLLPRLEARGIRGSSRDCSLRLSDIS